MKFPWDRRYLVIGFHVAITLAGAYVLINFIDAIFFVLGDIFTPQADGGVTFLGSILSAVSSLLRLFSPLIIAFIIAYLFDPLVDFYQKHYDNFKTRIAVPWLKKNVSYFNKISYKRKETKGAAFKSRMAGVLFTYLSVFVFLYFIIGLLVRSFTGVEEGFVGMINRTTDTFTELFENLTYIIEGWDIGEFGVADFVLEYLQTFVTWMGEFVLNLATTAVVTAVATGMWVLDFFISLVVAFYFMNHKNRIKSQLLSIMGLFVPIKPRRAILVFLGNVNFVFSGYIRGMILDGIILGTLIAIALTIIGVELAIPIGILTAVFNLIPYFGGIVAFVLSVGSELILGTPTNALYAAIAIIVIQQIDSIFIVPKVVGENVKLSAPVILLSLTIAGSVFGIIGMLLIVPTLAIIKIFVMRFIERYANYKKRS